MIPKCGQVNTKMESKTDVNLKWRFLKNRALAAAGARFFIIGASKLRRKIDRKSITKPSTRWNAPWHRLSFDFGRFRSASSGGKTIQNRCRKTSKIVMLLARGRVRPGSKGVFPLPSSGNTRTQDPGCRASLGILVATFLAISLLFFFASFFDAFLGRSWLRFPSQLASQNRPKSKKNRCQDAIHLGLRFLIDFWSVLALNLDPFDPKKLNFSWKNKVF